MSQPSSPEESGFTLRIKFKSETLDKFISRYGADVSPGGIFIRTKDPLSVGTVVKFDFLLFDGSPLFAGRGTVVWIREHDPTRPGNMPGMGVRFDRLSPESQSVLSQVLAQKSRPQEEASPPGASGAGGGVWREPKTTPAAKPVLFGQPGDAGWSNLKTAPAGGVLSPAEAGDPWQSEKTEIAQLPPSFYFDEEEAASSQTTKASGAEPAQPPAAESPRWSPEPLRAPLAPLVASPAPHVPPPPGAMPPGRRPSGFAVPLQFGLDPPPAAPGGPPPRGESPAVAPGLGSALGRATMMGMGGVPNGPAPGSRPPSMATPPPLPVSAGPRNSAGVALPPAPPVRQAALSGSAFAAARPGGTAAAPSASAGRGHGGVLKVVVAAAIAGVSGFVIFRMLDLKPEGQTVAPRAREQAGAPATPPSPAGLKVVPAAPPEPLKEPAAPSATAPSAAAPPAEAPPAEAPPAAAPQAAAPPAAAPPAATEPPEPVVAKPAPARTAAVRRPARSQATRRAASRTAVGSEAEPSRPAPLEPAPTEPVVAAEPRATGSAAETAVAPSTPVAEEVFWLRVTSNPPGADVLLDGNVEGKTPFQRRIIDPNQSYTVTVRRAGFEPHERSIGPSDTWVTKGTSKTLTIAAKLVKAKPAATPPGETTPAVAKPPAGSGAVEPKPSPFDDPAAAAPPSSAPQP